MSLRSLIDREIYYKKGFLQYTKNYYYCNKYFYEHYNIHAFESDKFISIVCNNFFTYNNINEYYGGRR